MNTKKTLAACALAFAGLVGASGAQAVPVALELALLVDVSGSVDTTEYDLQKQGYVDAFNNSSVQALIANATGGIAVTFIEWSGANQQKVQVDWTHITDAASASAFATAIGATTRAFSNLTAPGSAINFAYPLFTNNGFEGTRLVIDVSGDGSQNDGANTALARDAALNAGISAINGLPILGSEAGLLQWYQNNIQGGTGSFTIAAASFADFGKAVQDKIGREIQGVPEPGTVALFGLGLLGLGALRRKLAA